MDCAKTPRGKVPDYPRPVPDFDFDEIPICPNTITYESWAHSTDKEAEERATKRQKRRRDAAEAYLRGGEIRILTAGLRGPFEGWRNPWAKSRPGVTKKTAMEVPETAVKHADQLCRPPTPVQPHSGPEKAHISLDDDDNTRFPIKPLILDENNPFAVKKQIENSVLNNEPSSTRRVEDWLRTNDIYTGRSEPHIGSSPTPITRSPRRPPGLPQPRSSPIRLRACDANLVHGQDHRVIEAFNDRPASRGNTEQSEALHESPLRAETAILEQKRRSLQELPPSTNLPAFDRRGGREQHSKTEIRPAPTSAQEVPYAAQTSLDLEKGSIQKPSLDHTSSPAPSNSDHQPNTKPAGLSRASTVQNLPSAQEAPVPPQAAISNAQSTDELLQKLSSATNKTLRDGRQDVPEASADAAKVSVAGPEAPGGMAKDQDAEAPEAPANEPVSVDHSPVREPETQEMIAGLKPFEISTSKKPAVTFSKRQTPYTAAKVQPGTAQKRASFAVDHPFSCDSQKSIKMSLKVKKGVALALEEKPVPQLALFEEAPGGLEPALVAATDESLPSLSSMFGRTKASVPKSILKSSNAISSAPVPSGNTESTSMKQDAQALSGKAGQVQLVDDDDGFDLDAAIDDLGSYLGTWDAEQEAMKVSAEA